MKMAIRWREELESSVQRVHVCVCFTSKLLCKLLLHYLIMPSGLIVPSIAVDVISGFSVLGLFCGFFFLSEWCRTGSKREIVTELVAQSMWIVALL